MCTILPGIQLSSRSDGSNRKTGPARETHRPGVGGPGLAAGTTLAPTGLRALATASGQEAGVPVAGDAGARRTGLAAGRDDLPVGLRTARAGIRLVRVV